MYWTFRIINEITVSLILTRPILLSRGSNTNQNVDIGYSQEQKIEEKNYNKTII